MADSFSWLQDQTPFTFQFPGCLPSNYQFDGIGLSQPQKTPLMTPVPEEAQGYIEYEKSGSKVRITESPSPIGRGDVTATTVPLEGTTANFQQGEDGFEAVTDFLTWSRDDVYFEIAVTPAGKLAPETLAQIAESMHSDESAPVTPDECE